MISPMMRNAAGIGAFCLGLALAAIAPARAEDAARGAAEQVSRAAPLVLRDYRTVFEQCRNSAGKTRLAIRRMSANGAALLLTVDPQSLETKLERAQCWRCADTTDEAQADTRYLRALRPPADPALPRILANAGLLHGEGAGVFVTGDLCPSRRPLDRTFFERLSSEGAHAPVALAVSGLWLERHRADFDWLKRKAESGALDITWVNHSYHHPYVRDRPDAATYLLTPGLNLEAEILGAERLLIEQGATPSVFFRFPGLVADARLLEEVRRRHLVPLGADSWLALGPPPRTGSIVLVHPNGNEPAGLGLFSRLLERGKMPRPFRPINEAP
jgi:hypothetical protein